MIDELKFNIENAINDSILPKPYYEFEVRKVYESELLIVKVYKGDHTPYIYKNKAYMRRDTSTIQVDIITYQNLILAGQNLGYENLLSNNQKLNFYILENLMKKYYQITSLSEDLLKILGLLDENGYNNAALLLSDENSLESAVIQLVAFSDKGVGRIKDRTTVKSRSLISQFDDCMSFYHKHINIGEIIESAYRRTIEEVPYIAYREAVANMLVHRDYGISVDSRVKFFSDRIEVVSLGGLPLGLLEEEYVEGRISRARNRKVADIFLQLKIIEKLATGVRRIKEQYFDQDVKPRFIVSENSVIVVLPYVNDASNKDVILNSERGNILKRKEKQIYNIINSNFMIKRIDIQNEIGLEKSQTIELLNKLRDLGKIIKIGNGPATGYKIMK